MFSEGLFVRGRSWTLAILATFLPGVAMGQSLEDVCTGISEAEKEQNGILEVDWVPAGAVDRFWSVALTTRFQSPPAIYPRSYCLIVFTMGDRGATVSLDGTDIARFVDGTFVDFNQKQPWYAILRVPESYDGARTFFEVPSGGSSFVAEEGGHQFWRFIMNMPAAYVTAKPLFAFFSPDCPDPLDDECPQFAAPNRRPAQSLIGINAASNRAHDI